MGVREFTRSRGLGIDGLGSCIGIVHAGRVFREVFLHWVVSKGGIIVSVFKILQVELDEAKQRLALSNLNTSVRHAKDWVELLSRVEAYVQSLAWHPKSPYKREIRIFLQNDCSYQKAARQCDVSPQWMYSVVWQAHWILQRRFDEVLRAIRDGNIHAVDQAFRKATEDSASPLEWVIRHHYQPVRHDAVNLESCADELGFLRRLFEVEDTMLGLHRNKVEHLLYLMRGDHDDRVVRQYLYQCLQGYWGVDETLERLAEHEAARRPILAEEG